MNRVSTNNIAVASQPKPKTFLTAILDAFQPFKGDTESDYPAKPAFIGCDRIRDEDSIARADSFEKDDYLKRDDGIDNENAATPVWEAKDEERIPIRRRRAITKYNEEEIAESFNLDLDEILSESNHDEAVQCKNDFDYRALHADCDDGSLIDTGERNPDKCGIQWCGFGGMEHLFKKYTLELPRNENLEFAEDDAFTYEDEYSFADSLSSAEYENSQDLWKVAHDDDSASVMEMEREDDDEFNRMHHIDWNHAFTKCQTLDQKPTLEIQHELEQARKNQAPVNSPLATKQVGGIQGVEQVLQEHMTSKTGIKFSPRNFRPFRPSKVYPSPPAADSA